MRISPVFLVAVGGAVGSLGRWTLDEVIGAHGHLPSSTLLVNVMGSLLLGLLVGRGISDRSRLLWGTGVLGGFTTYSAFAVQTEQLVRDGQQVAWAVGYPVLAVALGLAAAVVGLMLGRRLAGGAA